MESTIAVIGGGAWGTALSVHLARAGHRVGLWLKESDLVDRMLRSRDNPVYLPGVDIPDGVSPTGSLEQASRDARLLLAAVPTPYARGLYRDLVRLIPPRLPIVVTSKGVEETSLALPLQVVADECGETRPAAVLSGPSFAREVAQGLPAALVVASHDGELNARVQSLLASSRMRVYTNPDPIGVQVSGALKNVIAIAAGVADSLGMGANAVAALITRGLAEMTRLGTAMGGRAATFSGLAGLGDLVLTCTGELSRNRRVGQRIGHGERLDDILSTSRAVAEGVRTVRAAAALANRQGVEMPIVEEVHRMLYENGSPQQALQRLLGRPLTSEDEITRPGRR